MHRKFKKFLSPIERAVLSALAIDDDRKGALSVRAIRAGMDDDEVLEYVADHGRLTTLNAIRWYRSGLNQLEYNRYAGGGRSSHPDVHQAN